MTFGAIEFDDRFTDKILGVLNRHLILIEVGAGQAGETTQGESGQERRAVERGSCDRFSLYPTSSVVTPKMQS